MGTNKFAVGIGSRAICDMNASSPTAVDLDDDDGNGTSADRWMLSVRSSVDYMHLLPLP